MGTKIQSNPYLREYHSLIDLDASTSNAMNEKWILENGKNPDSLSSYDIEKVRRTILEHESTFRNQLRELHRLHGRQQELMNEIKRRGINKDGVMEEKFQLSYLFSPFPTENAKRPWSSCHSSSPHSVAGRLPMSGTSSKLVFSPTQDKRSLNSCEPRVLNDNSFPSGSYNLGFPADSYFSNMEKRVQERFSEFPIVESTSEKRSHQAACDRDSKFSLSAVQTSQHGADALTFNLYNRSNYPGEISLANPTHGIPGRLALSKAEIAANSVSNFNLAAEDFFHDSLDRMNKEGPLSILGLRNETSGKEHPSNDNADHFPEKRRIDKNSSVGDLFSGKSLAYPQSLLAEPRKEFSNCPLDIGTSLSRKKKKIFGVEISEGNDDAFDLASNMSSNLDRRAGPHEENHRVPTLESSSLIADSFVQNRKLHVANWNGGQNERSKADSKGEISSQKRLSCHSGMNGKWLEGDFRTYFKNVDNTNKAAEVLKKDPEHSQKLREMIPQRPVLADCQSNQENPKGSLPWFLRNSGVSADLNDGTKSSYFMNLDSLQNCSQKFFRKAEMPYGTLQNSNQKKEVDVEVIEDNDGTGAKKNLGLPISDMLQSFKDTENVSKVNCSVVGDTCAKRVEVDENGSRNHLGTKDLVLDKGLNNYISDLRHCIDLNLSLDEEDASSAPSLPSAIVKIATTEIDLEAPAAIDSEVDADASPEELDSRKSDVLSGNTGLPYQECDKIAAEAMIAISLSVEKELVDEFNSLKWFAEVISSESGDNASVVVDVSLDHYEESIVDGMDYFEFMTLKLEDTKEEHYYPEPFVLKTPSDDETGAALTRRTRRGQSRRGRQRRDFQRDILPGLVTLSRLEVTEDFQAFEELLKAGDSTWQSGLSHRSSTRNGRGRKRLGGATTSPTMKMPCSTEAQQPVCQTEERSLTGWGKKTRRLPRQRCPNAFLSFPVKC